MDDTFCMIYSKIPKKTKKIHYFNFKDVKNALWQSKKGVKEVKNCQILKILLEMPFFI